MDVRRLLVLTTAALLVVPAAWSGHELPVYPSYYPHEIEIAAMEPQQAGERLGKGKLHAYVGGAPRFAAAAPKAMASAPSLGSFVVVKINPASAAAKDEASACAVVGAVVRALADKGGDAVAHPYPVTPLHGDYLTHADLAEAAKARFDAGAPPECGEGAGVGGSRRGSDPSPPTLRKNRDGKREGSPPCGSKLRAEGPLAQSLVRPEWRAEGADWDAVIQEADAGLLVASATSVVNGWMGPGWVRSGWYQAYRLLADILDPQAREGVEADVARLESGEAADPTERANLERDLVRRLTAGCRGAVAGYTVKREYYNASFSDGVENIAFDALEGLASPMFLRTVKLKDFPWNGWLKLGVAGPPAAAWNPVGGFTDGFGRLVWFAVSDPAAIPSPYDHGWVLNRISEVEAAP